MKPATLLLLNAPDFLEFGIDNQYWKVGSKFKVFLSPGNQISASRSPLHLLLPVRRKLPTKGGELYIPQAWASIHQKMEPKAASIHTLTQRGGGGVHTRRQ